MTQQSQLAALLKKYETSLLADWIGELRQAGSVIDSRISEVEIQAQAKEFLNLMQVAAQGGNVTNIALPEWAPVRQMLEELSRSRALQGFTSLQVATFIFSFKKPLFSRLRVEHQNDPKLLGEETWVAIELLDKLGLHTVKSYQAMREEIISRQQEEMLELSTPVVKLWDGILALPMIGTLDSARTQIVMETLLERIVETGSEIAIIDITGVPTVDTLVAQHLLKTITAIRLMGAECIISGIRPQIAQTIVHLGVELHGVTTKANLADALALALKRCNLSVSKLSNE